MTRPATTAVSAPPLVGVRTMRGVCIGLVAAAALGLGACKSDTAEPVPEALPPATPMAEGSEAPPSARPVAPVIPVLPPQQPAADRDLAVRLGLVPPDPLVVAQLLTHADIRELVRYDGELAVRTLDGLAPSPHYNVIRLGAGEQYGFALQVWRLEEARQVAPRYDRLKETYIVATEDPTPVGDASFHGEFAGVRHHGFSHRASRSVAVVTCEATLCTQPQARALAERVLSRL